jgi:sortase A
MKRSNRRKFRRRRQTAAFILFGSFAMILLSGMLFLNTKPEEETAALKVQRLQAPDVANAPDVLDADTIEGASKEQAAAQGEDANREESGDEAEEPAKEEPASRDESEKEAAPEAPAIPEPNSTDLYLTVPKMGLTDNYVANTEDPIAMDNGAIKLPSTGFPWQNNANTYIAAHVLGYAGTGSYMQFAGLPSMTYGDVIYLTDANGTVYEYAVTEILTVYPQDNWVTDPIAGKDMVTLQTCVNPPAYDQRLVVRAERTNVQTA